MSIADNLQRIQAEVQNATLVAVTKYSSPEQITELLAAGQRILGEARPQVAQEKKALYAQNYPDIHWHLIGHLQSNKAKIAVQTFALIHSVDSLNLAQAISKEAGKINKTQNILLQVNIGQEPQKSGFDPADIQAAYTEIKKLPHLTIQGLMAMAPLCDDPEMARPYFKQMKQLFDGLGGLSILSLGMSNDYLIALEEGATMVRIGSKLFE